MHTAQTHHRQSYLLQNKHRYKEQGEWQAGQLKNQWGSIVLLMISGLQKYCRMAFVLWHNFHALSTFNSCSQTHGVDGIRSGPCCSILVKDIPYWHVKWQGEFIASALDDTTVKINVGNGATVSTYGCTENTRKWVTFSIWKDCWNN